MLRDADVLDLMKADLSDRIQRYFALKEFKIREFQRLTGVPRHILVGIDGDGRWRSTTEYVQQIDRALPPAWQNDLAPTSMGIVLSKVRARSGVAETHYSQNADGTMSRDQLPLERIQSTSFLQALERWQASEGVVSEEGLRGWTSTGNVSAISVGSSDPLSYRITHHAQDVHSLSGINKTGHRFRDNRFELYGSSVAFDYMQCKMTIKPVYGLVAFRNFKHGEERVYERLLLPVSADANSVTHVLSAVEIHHSSSEADHGT